MSSHPHHEIAPICDRQIAITRPWRIVRRSLVPAVAAVGICLAATAAATDGAAHATPGSVKAAGHAALQQPAREMAALHAKGYTPEACTVLGTLMRNDRTGQSVIVRL